MDKQSIASRGRGALLRRHQTIDESAPTGSDSSDTSSLVPASDVSGRDSGAPSTTSGDTTPATTGPLYLSHTTSSSGSGSQPSRAAGRAKLLARTHGVSSDEGFSSGRGKMLFSLKESGSVVSSKIGSDETTTVKSSDEELAEKASISLSVSTARPSTVDTAREPVIKRGTKGRTVDLMANYIHLKLKPDRGVFEYQVEYDPPVISKNLRYRYLNQHMAGLGGEKVFDGITLYLPMRLPDSVTVFQSRGGDEKDSEVIQVRIVYKRQKRMGECTHLYNVLFDRIFKVLKYVRSQRKQFDPTAPKLIPQHKLEIWPGYVTAVDEYEGGMMLQLDVSHRVLRQMTVLELLRDIYNSSRNDIGRFRDDATKSLLGAIFLTRYNNKTYRVDEVLFDMTPESTFEARSGEHVTYADYYLQHHGLEIRDMKQPLLLSRQERRVSGQKEPQTINLCFVPELCYLTGLSDTMRSDYKVMKDVATYTRITPAQRLKALKQFLTNVRENDDCRALLGQWGLEIDESVITLKGRQLDEERVCFKNTTIGVGPDGDFNRDVTKNQVLTPMALDTWLLIYTRRDEKCARSFVDIICRIGGPMGIRVSAPQMEVLNDDRTETYQKALRTKLNANLKIVVVICPTSRDDRYAMIKKLCCSESPIPSQVILARTLANEQKSRSIVQKIALQMNCKMGGTLWSIAIPFDNVMICGVDTFHDAGGRGASVAGFVASLDRTYTRWYSRAVMQARREELQIGLAQALSAALLQYRNVNQRLPDRIIVFRDGVGDGQLPQLLEHEIPQLRRAWAGPEYGDSYAPEFVFIVVQKRINTRMMAMNRDGTVGNPTPGTVLDHTVTRRYLYDFFLVPQSVRQGTVTPTHYVVLADDAELAPDIVQRLSYKLCYLYYNWPGSVRVPACCQYAHKLAFLVGEHIKRPTDESLATKLFYL